MSANPPSATDGHDLILRLRRIEGQVRGLQHMVEIDARLIDTVTQLTAIRGALAAVGSAIVAGELTRLVPHASAQDVATFRNAMRRLTDR